jgi:hypothetical protein
MKDWSKKGAKSGLAAYTTLLLSDALEHRSRSVPWSQYFDKDRAKVIARGAPILTALGALIGAGAGAMAGPKYKKEAMPFMILMEKLAERTW